MELSPPFLPGNRSISLFSKTRFDLCFNVEISGFGDRLDSAYLQLTNATFTGRLAKIWKSTHLIVRQRAILISHTPLSPLPDCESGLAGQRNLLPDAGRHQSITGPRGITVRR